MDDLQALIDERANKAPRVTPEDIEAAIASEHYYTAGQGVYTALGEGSIQTKPLVLDLLTHCTLVLKNGFTVTGQSACASPENFDAEVGRMVARRDAVRQVWPLLGFRLRDQLTVAGLMGQQP